MHLPPLFILWFPVIASCVEIRDLGVPSWGLEGGEVELSCCFSLEEKSHYPELDVKCYHGSSPFIFPPGFCERNKIKLKPPGEIKPLTDLN